jgi:hypothetical protein
MEGDDHPVFESQRKSIVYEIERGSRVESTKFRWEAGRLGSQDAETKNTRPGK